jgi:hypothetical protein
MRAFSLKALKIYQDNGGLSKEDPIAVQQDGEETSPESLHGTGKGEGNPSDGVDSQFNFYYKNLGTNRTPKG